MHPCLSVPEIFALICDCFTLSDRCHYRERSRNRKTLKSLTLCQRSFYDAALATLWQDQPLTSLLRSLPPDVYKDGNKAQDFVVVRQITLHDIERFTFYTALIRRLSTLNLRIDRSCLIALRDVCPQPLLPNLRFLLWKPSEAAPVHLRSMLLAPGLLCLELHLPATDEAMLMVPHLHESCPEIQEFALWPKRTGDEKVGGLGIASSLTRRWDNLTVFRVPHVNADDLPYLASLPRLMKLAFGYCYGDSASVPSIPSPAFTALQSLTINQERIEYSIALLRALLPQSMKLNELCLRWDEGSQAEWPALIAAIAHSCHHPSLKRLRLYDKGQSLSLEFADEYLPWPGALDFATMQPLASFSNLIELSFICPRSYVLTDDDLQCLAEAWPLMESLHLRTESNHHSRRPQYLTARALVDVAWLCPCLQRLSLDFDASTSGLDDVSLDLLAQSWLANVHQHPLSWLNVGYSRISDAPAVVNLFSFVFPTLLHLVWYTNTRAQEYGGEDYLQEVARVSRWREVESEVEI
ncbi:uncharacterized protein SCHCODRAFT_02751937 [Schizophyllum commune H4-8]|nr:uncharacterized protein SCHCODRAFT_02751937 [Schizophyllum commune H4-8]KAI5887437.1 hypothetical protein SCHCODRAFT_02751937 [Schizophyllum commune H4-8]